VLNFVARGFVEGSKSKKCRLRGGAEVVVGHSMYINDEEISQLMAFDKIFKINPKERCSCQEILDFLKAKIDALK